MEPSVAGPWIARGVSWLLLATGFGLLSPLALLVMLDRGHLAVVLARVGMGSTFAGLGARWVAAGLRPTPVYLRPYDEDS
jgi:hypothetical protein